MGFEGLHLGLSLLLAYPWTLISPRLGSLGACWLFSGRWSLRLYLCIAVVEFCQARAEAAKKLVNLWREGDKEAILLLIGDLVGVGEDRRGTLNNVV